LNGSAYALRSYGVTLGSSSSHDPFFSRKAARNPQVGIRQALGVPNFSRKAASLHEAMGALSRKWVSGSAPTLESTSALPRGA
jgi:hypothetical protein